MDNTQAVIYYGCAQKSRKPRVYGILRVTKRKGQPSSQEWTGEEFKTWDAAVARQLQLNREQAANDPVWIAIAAAAA